MGIIMYQCQTSFIQGFPGAELLDGGGKSTAGMNELFGMFQIIGYSESVLNAVY